MKIINTIVKPIDNFIEYFSTTVYYMLVGFIYLFYIVTAIGIAYINPDYVKYLNIIIQTFIAFILIVRFNPFRSKVNCNKNDRVFILASSFFLLLNDEFVGYLKTFFKKHLLTNLPIYNELK